MMMQVSVSSVRFNSVCINLKDAVYLLVRFDCLSCVCVACFVFRFMDLAVVLIDKVID